MGVPPENVPWYGNRRHWVVQCIPIPVFTGFLKDLESPGAKTSANFI